MSVMRTQLARPTAERVIIESMFMVIDKESRKDIPFKFNPTQAKLDANLTGRDLVPKARQEGVSTYVLARYTAACMMKRNTRAVVVSHETESTQRMLNMVKYFIANIRGPAPEISNLSKNEIVFPKMNSMFYIGTAGARAFGRGDTITHLHCSEYAYWINPGDLMNGLMEAVPERTGEIIIESTGNGTGNDYHQRCMRARTGNSRWKLHFFDWQSFPDYTVELSEAQEQWVLDTVDPDWEEDRLVGILSPGQLLFRRNKLEDKNFDLKKLKQEYPMTLDECFQSTGSGLFNKVLYQPTDRWRLYDGDEAEHFGGKLYMLDGHPDWTKTYVIGGDVSAGVEQDDSVLEVFCVDSMEQVGEWISGKTEPDVMAHKAAKLGTMFGDALLVIEANNHGILTLATLRDSDYPQYKIYRHASSQNMSDIGPIANLGFKTTPTSRPLAIGMLRRDLAKNTVIHSEVLKDQLSTFVENEMGKLEAQEGCKDDAVIAAAMAAVGMPKAALAGPKDGRALQITKPQEDTNPFVLGNIIKELKGRQSGGFLIPPQHKGAE